ncbi:aromatic amino acid hydroxylase [Brevibacillus laterosporus]|uniref:aromatic amino acid hydroxylase n=1 Tax=Brevibacillus laterosporus TaxID=1465 RepID=UPI001EF2B0DA|nr:aromatic amino acid hydroxylase [Brevibacillus laterosporus]MCG7317328.1 aromatic amino acid hydroxylase [Brevibacillus laterosporus]MED1789422.1 aromatic amino acid hydroxylase [Brevibacillus laterosporus]
MSQIESDFSLVNIPIHLKQFVVDQDYDKYTPIDQAVWRYVMRQNYNFLGKRAHTAYLEGLQASGISIEKIPNIREMNRCLSEIGWGAVSIDGFIPAVAFFDFQAHNILPIACDIRTYDHVAYTPAPDIIHEAAGHAPIIKDEKYREYLKIFGAIGSKAISSRADYELYEAIRYLSIVKEDINATEEQVLAAEEELVKKTAAVTEVSEATQLSRLYWWTVEYGLIGDVNNPQIYGAGLLSSVGESMSCLTDGVKKIPFSLDACIETDFDITKPQPQLFVCCDFDQLIEAVLEMKERMALHLGGTESLHKAVNSGQITTSVYSSGLQVSGTLHHTISDEQGEAIYLATEGPTALALQDIELVGHDKSYHSHGFSSPIGKIKGIEKPLENWTDAELEAYGLVVGKKTVVCFASGVEVVGRVSYIDQKQDKVVLIGFDECTVRYQERVLFQAEWGIYDMAVGAEIISVYAGAADREKFQSGTHQPSETQTRRPIYTKEQKRQQQLYQIVRNLRTEEGAEEELPESLQAIRQELDASYPNDWLLRLEILEMMLRHHFPEADCQRLHSEIKAIGDTDHDLAILIANGLSLLENR